MGVDTTEAESSARELLQHLGLIAPPVLPNQIITDLGYTQLPLWEFKNSGLMDDQLRVMSKLVGAAGIAQKAVYVLDQLPSRKHQWLLLHESGHIWMRWHQELSYMDTDFELSPTVRETMEVEANAFAAEVRFFGDDFRERMKDYDCNHSGISALADVYGASMESTVNHYVRNSSRPIWLHVLKPTMTAEGEQTLTAQYYRTPKVAKPSFRNSMKIGQSLSPDDQLVRSIFEDNLQVGEEMSETFDLPEVGPIKTRIFWTGYKAYLISTI